MLVQHLVWRTFSTLDQCTAGCILLTCGDYLQTDVVLYNKASSSEWELRRASITITLKFKSDIYASVCFSHILCRVDWQWDSKWLWQDFRHFCRIHTHKVPDFKKNVLSQFFDWLALLLSSSILNPEKLIQLSPFTGNVMFQRMLILWYAKYIVYLSSESKIWCTVKTCCIEWFRWASCFVHCSNVYELVNQFPHELYVSTKQFLQEHILKKFKVSVVITFVIVSQLSISPVRYKGVCNVELVGLSPCNQRVVDSNLP